ncbi:aminotransferase class V-fold PLP-dependent enzyme [Dyella telluris]|uniref:Aminotransferase class V-fold PLP-dependent enzyme n=1 Tax=Dyella telluris TaxID=2763498 RepID=A0A7G8Q8R0_9GAMM|nr:aminotransferase class V-fold PLP-dependent enzyme [Dyella telluris]QNK03168.1 aminotransferase class V-fold PLP-dependent enzyme [Dyella telluris]
MNRRNFLAAAGLAATAPLYARAGTPAPAGADMKSLPTIKGLGGIEFYKNDGVYLDSGSMHPVSVGSRATLDAYLADRMGDPRSTSYHQDPIRDRVLGNFAQMINADRSEVTLVQSTTAGEQLVLRALGLPAAGAHVVTDTMHFFGSFYLYEAMAKLGVDVTWVRPKNNRIDLDDIEAAVKKGTKLVAISAVSTFNGFQHDLKRVCEIAHAKGARVYADIIHAAGCVPLDVKATGVDFAACASYKWLMGDFGLGFLYVRKDRLPELQHPVWGYYQLNAFQSHVYPFDPPGDDVADYGVPEDASGYFMWGTFSHMGIGLLDYSLDYIQKVGVPAIQAHAKPLTDHLKTELPKRGFELVTPMESTAPLVTFAYKDAANRLRPKMKEAQVDITISRNRFRFSPSVFNTMEDIDRAMHALGTA